MLLALNSFDFDIDASTHPKLFVIFNNVSLQEENEANLQGRIDQYKLALKANAKNFYLNEVSDETIFGEKTWAEIKGEVCASDSYKAESWYETLPREKKELIEMLKDIQGKEDLS